MREPTDDQPGGSPAPAEGPGAAAAFVRDTLDAGADALRETAQGSLDVVIAVADAWTRALRRGGKILLFGNGGSHADSQHLAGELVNRFRIDRQALPSIALATSVPILTSVANDDAYERIFAREVEAFGRPGDVAVGLTTSGGSPNVVAALEAAKARGLVTQAFVGAAGGAAADVADLAFRAPSTDTPIIQQAHMAVGHIVCDLVERALVDQPSE